jgi:hypothetical protein
VAGIKMMEYIAAENSDIFAVSVHPGLVATKMFTTAGAEAENLPMDTRELFSSLDVFTYLFHRSSLYLGDATNI